MFFLDKNKKINRKNIFKKGMTYVELIVVLSIFSIMSAVSLFNYGKFQAKIDIKNLSNDIALQIVGVQRDALAGKIPTYPVSGSWKPAYGVHFDLTEPKQFKSFADVDSSNNYNPAAESVFCQTDGECVDKIDITKGNTISHLEVFDSSVCSGQAQVLDILFRRPDSSAIVSADGVDCGFFKEVLVGVESPEGVGAKIYVYPSGRIEFK
jgi:prepilin-type N-terminal cleavage/methylation domain-containing protein